MGRRAIGLATVSLVAVLLQAAAGADYLMLGATPDRAGVVESAGPEWPDVAWSTKLPGTRAIRTSPVLLGDAVYVLVSDYNIEGEEFSGLFRLDRETGEATLVVKEERPIAYGVSDGTRYVYAGVRGFVAVSLPDGAPLWEWPVPPLLTQNTNLLCFWPAVHDATVFIHCDVPDRTMARRVFTAAVSMETGQTKWFWLRDADDDALRRPEASAIDSRAPLNPFAIAGPLTVIPPYVFAVDVEGVSPAGAFQATMWALDAETGRILWSRNATLDSNAYDAPLRTLLQSGDVLFAPPSATTGTPTIVYAKLGPDLLALNTATGQPVWATSLGAQDESTSSLGSGMALLGDRLYATSYQSVVAFDTLTQAPRWQMTLPRGSGEAWPFQIPLLDGERLYLRSSTLTRTFNHTATYYYGVDADDGEILWRWGFDVDPSRPALMGYSDHAVGDGLLIVVKPDGEVVALGRTTASPQVQVAASTLYPPPGAPVRLDASGTLAGARGPATSYRAWWGDGNATEWQASPVFEHAYAAAGDVVARVEAQNEAGQSASATLTLHVGGTPPPAPPELNVFQRAFAPENQELTFFGLGLLVTLAGAVAGVLVARHRRRLLARELHAAQETFERLRAEPAACRAALSSRRQRLADLMLRGRLHASEGVLVERLIRDLEAQLPAA